MTTIMEMEDMPAKSQPCGKDAHEACVYAWCTCHCHKCDTAILD